jgi:hypothetical protein
VFGRDHRLHASIAARMLDGLLRSVRRSRALRRMSQRAAAGLYAPGRHSCAAARWRLGAAFTTHAA